MQKIRKILMFQKSLEEEEKKGIILTNTIIERSSAGTEDLNDSVATTVVIRTVILFV